MVNGRPSFLDLSGAKFSDGTARRSPLTSPGELAPPKPGDIPPALSPLDALQLQSRLLARRFDQEQQNGKRLSRLPPLTVQHEFSKRPGFVTSASSGESSAADESPVADNVERANVGKLQQVEERDRPMSTHPSLEGDGLMSHKPHKPSLSGIGEEQEYWTPGEQPTPAESYFDLPLSDSPEGAAPKVTRPTPDTPRTASIPLLPASPQADAYSVDSLSIPSPKQSLRPPRSPMALNALRNSPSIRSIYDSSDDVEAFSMNDSMDSLPRKPSTNSSYSRSHSPAVFNAMPMPRSPSVASESSWTSVPRPSFNFSRPRSAMSRPSIDLSSSNATFLARQGTMDSTSTRPSLDVPSRQGTGDAPLTPMSMDMPRTPLTVASEDYFTADSDEPGQAYTYSKYRLPRGRAMNRESIAPGDFILKQFDWDAKEATRASLTRTPSPHNDMVRVQPPVTPPQTSSPSHLPIQRSASSDVPRDPPSVGSPQAPRSAHHKSTNSTPAASHRPSMSGSMQTASSASTIKAHLMHTKSPSSETTAEEHLQKGIELHEQGKLQESTYHLRSAANSRHPTAMLLYALACRHGWGMRPSQSEGVMWLQRAVDSMQLEVADDEDLIKRGSPDAAATAAADKKSHKAQFALSVYELGMSYMNGWGVRQDRALGLRCFEVAGNWGDADALAEAAFCYAEGVGAKKDLKVAARLYREAERKGMSMAGNSWIYKDKYMGSEGRPATAAGRDAGRSSRSAAKTSAENKKRDKSRTRTIFGRKKSIANIALP